MSSAVCYYKASISSKLAANAQPLALYSKSDHEVCDSRKLAAEVIALVDCPA
jgi:hypothetical protein